MRMLGHDFVYGVSAEGSPRHIDAEFFDGQLIKSVRDEPIATTDSS